MKFINKAALYAEVERIRLENGVSDPFEIARRNGIKVSLYAFDSRRLAGALMRGKNRAEIIVNARRSPEGRRFTVAHELMHFFLHRGANFFCCDQSAVTALEWQANEGAAELVLPFREFLSYYVNIRSLLLSDEEKALRLLAEKFAVSPAMAKARLASLGPEISQLEEGVPIEEIVPLSRRAAPAKQKASIDVFV